MVSAGIGNRVGPCGIRDRIQRHGCSPFLIRVNAGEHPVDCSVPTHDLLDDPYDIVPDVCGNIVVS